MILSGIFLELWCDIVGNSSVILLELYRDTFGHILEYYCILVEYYCGYTRITSRIHLEKKNTLHY